MTCNGVIAGLVAITAPSGYVESWAAPIIGLVAGVIVVVGVIAIDKVLDDPIGALSAHGLAGIWGTLACGLFTARGWPSPTGSARAGSCTPAPSTSSAPRRSAWSAAFASVFALVRVFFVIKATFGLRVKPEEERYGLDIVEHGMWGYPEQFMPVPGSEYHPPAAPAAQRRDRRRRPGAEGGRDGRRRPTREDRKAC